MGWDLAGAVGRGGVIAAHDFAGWNQVLELLLDQYADECLARMRKKLVLLVVPAQDFAYLTLDEPFNGLELEARLLLKEILRRLRGWGTGILLPSHILGTFTETADEISVLVGGRIQRHYAAAESGVLEADLPDALHPEKPTLLSFLLLPAATE